MKTVITEPVEVARLPGRWLAPLATHCVACGSPLALALFDSLRTCALRVRRKASASIGRVGQPANVL